MARKPADKTTDARCHAAQSLKRLRVAAGLTGSELARRAGVMPSVVWRAEKAEGVGVQTLCKLLAALSPAAEVGAELILSRIAFKPNPLPEAALAYLRLLLAAVRSSAAGWPDVADRRARRGAFVRIDKLLPQFDGDATLATAWAAGLLACERHHIGGAHVSRWAILPSGQTVGNVLRRHGTGRPPGRIDARCWREFLRLIVAGGTSASAWRRVAFLRRHLGWGRWLSHRRAADRLRAFDRDQPGWRGIAGGKHEEI